MMRTLASSLLGILLGTAALFSLGVARQTERVAVLMILIAVAGPAAGITGVVLHGIVDRLRRARGRIALGVRILHSAMEVLGLLLLSWIVLGVAGLAVHPAMVVPALAGGTGMTLGCLIGAGRCRETSPRSISLDTTGPPFFREPRVNA